MKRVFPLIVVLITLSVLGILFIQMQWITNAIQVKKDQYQQSREQAMIDAKALINEAFLNKRQILTGEVLMNLSSRQHTLEDEFTVQQYFTPDEMKNIIQSALRANGIKQPFEF